jgi:hypothetical protein
MQSDTNFHTSKVKTSIFEENHGWRFILILSFLAYAFMLWGKSGIVMERLGDTDDALRLVQVRELLDGAGWFNAYQMRFDPPQGLMMHWSRLIDAPIAAILSFFRLFFEPAKAELMTRLLWPFVPFWVAMAFTASIGKTLAGPKGFVIAALFIALSPPAQVQFQPGRIDHHNVQIMLTMMMIWGLINSQTHKFAPALSGIAAALTLNIGMETLPFVALVSFAFALQWVVSPNLHKQSAHHFGVSINLTSLAFFILTRHPDYWSWTFCDAMGPNYLALTTIGGVGLAILARDYSQRTLKKRSLAIFLLGMFALSIFAGLNPACLKGPYADVDPRIVPLWLSNVAEAQNIMSFIRQGKTGLIAVLLYPALMVLAAVIWMKKEDRRDQSVLTILIATCAALSISLWQIRSFALLYWILPLVGVVFISGIQEKVERYKKDTMILVAIMSPLCMVLLFSALLSPFKSNKGVSENSELSGGCFKNSSYTDLAALPKGLVMSHLDMGPFILAHTHHNAASGPYHRLGQAIYESRVLLKSTTTEAEAIVSKRQPTYLAFCKENIFPAMQKEDDKSLRAALAANTPPCWLSRVNSAENDPAIIIYKVDLQARP